MPLSSTLAYHLQLAEIESEYLFVLFAGHGYMKRSNSNSFLAQSEKELTMICLNDRENIPLSFINPNMKNFVMLDSCRGRWRQHKTHNIPQEDV